jgi:hypothetical protein
VFTVTAALSGVLAIAFTVAGAPKAAGRPGALKDAARLGYSQPALRRVGALEVTGSAGLLAGLAFFPLGVAAGTGFAILMAGAARAHLRAGDSFSRALPAICLGLVAVGEIITRIASA